MKAKPTLYAPAERASDTTIQNQVKSIFNTDYLQKLYDAVSEIIIILNKERQIVFCNHQLFDALNIKKKYQFMVFDPVRSLIALMPLKQIADVGRRSFAGNVALSMLFFPARRGKLMFRNVESFKKTPAMHWISS